MSRKLFTFGFALSLVLFVGANVYSYRMAEPPCCDLFTSFGFPLEMGTFGGYAGYTNILLSGFIANMLIGLGVSLVFGWVFTKTFPGIANLFRKAASMARQHSFVTPSSQ